VIGNTRVSEGVRWALPPFAESSYHMAAPRLEAWLGRLGGEGDAAVDNPQRAAANRARVDREGKRPPEPDPLSPDFISAARREKSR
jgi:hypothetical protein